MYGPEPNARPSSRSPLAAYWVWSTIEPAPEASLLGKVASEVLSRKTTAFASGVSTLSSIGNMIAGPAGSLIFSMRSKENLTSFEVSASPLLNLRPALRVHRWTRARVSVKEHSLAASGCGSVPPLGKLSSDWKTLLNNSQEPGS